MTESSPLEMRDTLEMVRVLGKAEIEFAGSLTAPLFCLMTDEAGNVKSHGGSMFFLDAGVGAFAVTAAHVVVACLVDSQRPGFLRCVIARDGTAPFSLNLQDRIISIHEGIDIATLRFSPDEIRLIGRTVLTGFQRDWPPRLCMEEGFVTYAGWPGVGRRWINSKEIVSGLVVMAGKVTSSHENCVSVQIEREALERVLGTEDMPENFDFGGMSGGPALQIVSRGGLRGWVLAGIVFQGPNPTGDSSQSITGLEIIRIRPAHFINADGTLDIIRWEQSQSPS